MNALSSVILLWLTFHLLVDAQPLRANLAELTPLQRNSRASIPPPLIALIAKHGLERTYEPVYDYVNPFYLYADFDADGLRDYAVLLRSKQGNAPAQILILRGNGRLNWLQKDIGDKGSLPAPAWWVLHKDEKVKARADLNNNQPAPRLTGDGLMVARPESSSALVYWDGRKFNLYWQSD